MKTRSGTVRKLVKTVSDRGMSDGAKALSMWSNCGLIKLQIPRQHSECDLSKALIRRCSAMSQSAPRNGRRRNK
jgi:hypothetical protein